MPRKQASRPAAAKAGVHFELELPDHVNALAWSPEGKLLAAATLAGPVALLEAGEGKVLRELPGHPGGALAVDFSPDGRLLATGGQDGLLRVYAVEDGRQQAEGKAGGDWVEHVAWSPTGQYVASAAAKVVRVWTPGLKHLGGYEAHPGTLTALYWLQDREEVVAGCRGGLFRSSPWRTEPSGYLEYEGAILAVEPSPNGRYIAAGCHEGTAYVWWLGETRDFTMPGHQAKVTALAWSPDSKLLATGDAEAIDLWSFTGSAADGAEPRRIEDLGGRVLGLRFREDGLLLCASEQGTLRGFQLGRTRRQLFAVETGEPLTGLKLSPGGQYAAAAGRHGKLFVFELPPAAKG
jgi:WD40 repeat protein